MILTKLSLFSKCLSRQVDVNVLLPQTMWEKGKETETKEYPTLYLLHGHGDNYSCWQRWTNIERYAGQNGMIVIMPSVDRSWYTDTTYGDAYFTFVTEELPAMCKNLFQGVSSRPETTFVAGLSMGGYGALKIGLTYPERYSAIAAFSAVTDIENFTKDLFAGNAYWQAIFGDVEHIGGSAHDLFHLAQVGKREGKPLPRVYLWCGTEDRLFPHTEKMRDVLLSLGYEVNYNQTSGNHSWPYWDREISRAIPYFLEK